MKCMCSRKRFEVFWFVYQRDQPLFLAFFVFSCCINLGLPTEGVDLEFEKEDGGRCYLPVLSFLRKDSLFYHVSEPVIIRKFPLYTAHPLLPIFEAPLSLLQSQYPEDEISLEIPLLLDGDKLMIAS